MGPNYSHQTCLGVYQVGTLATFQNGLLLIFFATVLLFYTTSLFRKTNKRKIPGPGSHFLGCLTNILALSDKRKSLKVFESWCATYGPIFNVNLGPYKIAILNSPEYIQKLLGSTDMGYLGKGFAYKPLKPLWQDGLILSKGEKWKFRRRVLEKHMFSFKTLLTYMSTLNEEGDKYMLKIGERFASGKEEEVEDLLMNYTLEVVTSAAFGKSVAEMDSFANGELNITDTINRGKEIVATRAFNPCLLLDFIWRLHPLYKVERIVIQSLKLMGAAATMDNRVIPGKKYRAGIKDDLTAAGVPVDGIIEESLTLMSAGYETTASSIHFLLLLLALHPEHQEICRNEIDSVFEDVDLCPSGQLQFRALSKLKHMEMCVNESLRLLPTVFFFERKIDTPLVLEEDLVLETGTEVAFLVQGLHKNPKYYPDPEKFIPGRFSEEEIKSRSQFAHIPFAAGPRKCIGYKFAMMIMLSFSAKLLREYVLETTEKLDEIVFLPNVTMSPETPIKFRIKKRLNK
ncbi:Cytochrome P450 4c21 [Orchesella cincta]|uniref:Cytochrome P450 4c21 n=1 Tax=Orchesella cincta TaxID=48709 RepID=A0A1D2MN55_ORCCI|nr:Cytochrome P450 4c21 [Orchesella cincta]